MIGGVILCGGRSLRMGRPKLELPVGNELMLQRVARILSVVATPLVVVAAPGQKLPDLGEVRVVRDEELYRGPLAGIAGGLSALVGTVSAAYVTAVDTPLLRPEFVQHLVGRLGDAEIVVPRDDESGFHHPLAAVYRTALAPQARSLVQAGRLRPLFLIEASRSIEIPVSSLRSIDPQLDSLRNINTPEEYQRLLEDLAVSYSGEDKGCVVAW